MTRRTPLRRIILQFSQMRLTDALTFIVTPFKWRRHARAIEIIHALQATPLNIRGMNTAVCQSR